ncbi:MAG TPA: winged helix-turn-helix domain-containing protein [Candidatus Baltobacteraceae bacterium]|jgi:hypothetical protein
MIAGERASGDIPFVGRADELGQLDRLTTGPVPSITFVIGIGGIGKSRFLDAFASRRRAAGGTVVRIDCRLVEPTEDGFYEELRRTIGGGIATCEDASQRLSGLGNVVLVLDDIDGLRLLDSWLRRAFVPALPPNVHLVFSGRDAPLSAWLRMTWYGAFRTLDLPPLDDEEATALLAAGGIDREQATRVNRFARGHPLALTLAAITLQSGVDPSLEELAFHRILDELARRHLAEIADPVTRRAIEAASLVRMVSTSLLGAMLPDVAPNDAFERLRSLPITRLTRDGLKLHDCVRDAVARDLRSSDPQRHLGLRRACWGRLRRELRSAPPSEVWRYTADMLYLLENPAIREAFFPSGAQRYAIEVARQSDEKALVSIAHRHDGTPGASLTATWLKERPGDFSVAHEPNGDPVGYYVMCEASQLESMPRLNDPVVARWSNHLAKNPVGPEERVLFLRRWLSRDEGESPCAIQAACWLDIKRTYMAYRPQLRRVYLTLRDIAPYAAAAAQLGFVVVDECEIALGDDRYLTAMLDFGPDSVDGWFSRLVAAELGIASSRLLDVGARELVVDTRRVALSPREFDTLYYLVQREGEVARREEIISEVWGDASEVGSNVVDVVIRGLRKKLLDRSEAIETVSGVGYRLRDG